MIVVKIELWPLGDEGRKRSLGVAFIINDGSGTERFGNYRVMLSKMKDATQPYRLARVRGWARRGSPWNLLALCIRVAEEIPTNDSTLRRDMVLLARRAMRGQPDMFPPTEVEEDDDEFADADGDAEPSGGDGEAG